MLPTCQQVRAPPHQTASLLKSCSLRFLQVGVNYDPMIAKLVVHGPDRPAALASMHSALQELQVGAVSGQGRQLVGSRRPAGQVWCDSCPAPPLRHAPLAAWLVPPL